MKKFFAENVLTEAFTKITNFIINKVKSNSVVDEDGCYTLEVEGIYINVEVDNSYLDVMDICYEPREIKEIIVDENNDLYFKCYIDDMEDDYDADYVSINNLVKICNILENEY